MTDAVRIKELFDRVPNLTDDQRSEYTATLLHMLENNRLPEDFFEYIGNGSYKECYALNDEYVIKFCCTANPTESERYILEEAARNGLIDLFIPCYFCHLEDYTVPLEYVGEDAGDYSWRYDYENHTDYRYYYDSSNEGNYIVIQPRAEIANSDYVPLKRLPFPDAADLKSPAISTSWNECVHAHYGEVYFKEFLVFCKTYGIWDLHSDNIGYYNDKPVILDWMSEKRGN